MKKLISIHHLQYLGGIFYKAASAELSHSGEVKKAIQKLIQRVQKNRVKRVTKELVYDNTFSVELVNDFENVSDTENGLVTFRICAVRERIDKAPWNVTKKIDKKIIVEKTYQVKYV